MKSLRATFHPTQCAMRGTRGLTLDVVSHNPPPYQSQPLENGSPCKAEPRRPSPTAHEPSCFVFCAQSMPTSSLRCQERSTAPLALASAQITVPPQSCLALLDKSDDGLVGGERRTRLRIQRLHDAVARRGQNVLHLHRLDHAQLLPLDDLIALGDLE